MLTTLIRPDGRDRFQICVSSFASINPVGARLYKLTEAQRQKYRVEMPMLETRDLDREAAELRLREWTLFLSIQDKIKK